jgi:hypothetical protein
MPVSSVRVGRAEPEGARTKPIPGGIRLLLAIDLALTIVYFGLFALGDPIPGVGRKFDLNGESNLPTWYASAQWLVVALLLAIVARRAVHRDRRRTWVIVLLPLMFLAMSIDEVAAIHEALGDLSDALLPSGTRAGTPLHTTGLWILILGIPAIVAIAGLLTAVWPLLRGRPGVGLIVAGVGAFLFGAVGLESLSNLVSPGTAGAVLQVAAEETVEAVAATVVLFGAWLLAISFGFEL